MVALIGIIIRGVIWGFATKKVVSNKGYEENWFWWGFFFGFIALIVALTKPSKNSVDVIIKKEEPKSIISLTKGNLASKIDINSSVQITSWNIKKEDNKDVILDVEFFNVGDRTVSALMLSISGFNSFGDKVLVEGKNSFSVIEQDMCVRSGKYGHLKTILPNQDIRKVEISVEKACFEDGTIEENINSNWIETKQKPLETKYLKCIETVNKNGRYYAIENADYWQCVCGFVNTGNKCKLCEMHKSYAMNYKEDSIENTYEQYLEDIRRVELKGQEKAEQIKKDAEIRRKNRRKFLVVGIVCVIIACICIKFIGEDAAYKNERTQISNYIEKSKFDEAYSVMVSSDNYEKLSDEYGTLLYEEQIKLDSLFRGWRLLERNSGDSFNSTWARNGVCYYEFKELHDNQIQNGVRAVSNDRTSENIFWGIGSYVDICEQLYSNCWWFVEVTKNNGANYEHYAIKFDKDTGRMKEIELCEYNSSVNYVKMKDGNVLISSEMVENMEQARVLKIFDTVDEKISNISYDDLKKLYDDIEGNILK